VEENWLKFYLNPYANLIDETLVLQPMSLRQQNLEVISRNFKMVRGRTPTYDRCVARVWTGRRVGYSSQEGSRGCLELALLRAQAERARVCVYVVRVEQERRQVPPHLPRGSRRVPPLAPGRVHRWVLPLPPPPLAPLAPSRGASYASHLTPSSP
jgi:hypothetical protein